MGLHVFVNDVLTNQGAPFPIFVESDENRVNSTEGKALLPSSFTFHRRLFFPPGVSW